VLGHQSANVETNFVRELFGPILMKLRILALKQSRTKIRIFLEIRLGVHFDASSSCVVNLGLERPVFDL
jgi:hypothetical protein